jgi:hypothetical protein
LERNYSEDSDGEEEGDDGVNQKHNTPPKRSRSTTTMVKSPAKRHTKQRMSRQFHSPISSSSSSEESEDEDDDEVEEESEGEEQEEMKINKIIAAKSMTLKEWREVCSKMNTSEVTNGSRWLQDDLLIGDEGANDDGVEVFTMEDGSGEEEKKRGEDEDGGDKKSTSGGNNLEMSDAQDSTKPPASKKKSKKKKAAADPNKYEERFLVKWADLSFLHCSWETEKDLVEFCEGAKMRISTFFRKSEGGLLYEADERLDGVSRGVLLLLLLFGDVFAFYVVHMMCTFLHTHITAFSFR